VLPQEGSRECRAPEAPAASRVEKNTRVSHHGHAGNTRHSPRDGFNSLFRALPGDRAFLPPSPTEMSSANLTPASGRQDHTTSPSAREALSSGAHLASTASRPAFVTIASRPSVGRDGGGYAGDLGQKGTKIFLRRELDMQITFLRFRPGPLPSSFRGASEASEPGIHNPCREHGFRACATRILRCAIAHRGMTVFFASVPPTDPRNTR
jgi:hypothetical protein